jgi:sulfur-oxidizing protein SoxZ
MASTRIVLPARVKTGQIVTIKTLIQHPMETGFRRNDTGGAIARDIIETFAVTYGGVEIFRAKLYPGIAANPYFQFTTVAGETGELVFTWTDMKGTVTRETRTLTVA